MKKLFKNSEVEQFVIWWIYHIYGFSYSEIKKFYIVRGKTIRTIVSRKFNSFAEETIDATIPCVRDGINSRVLIDAQVVADRIQKMMREHYESADEVLSAEAFCEAYTEQRLLYKTYLGMCSPELKAVTHLDIFGY